MESDAARVAGARRFHGFADLYDEVRPVPPAELGALLAAYAGRRPEVVVDLGSGSGLSSRWAATWADAVIGVEPGDDMRARAEAGATPSVSFRSGWSHATGLPDGCADVVVTVQALHWMEPEPTYAEVARLLRPGGVFAAIDCDWPPVVGDARAEAAWEACRRRIRVYEARLAAGASDTELLAPVDPHEDDTVDYSGVDPHGRRPLPEGVRSWSKGGHLDRMAASGRFAWTREVAVAAATEGDGARLVGLLRSQGDYQTLRRHGVDDARLGLDRFAAVVADRVGATRRPWWFVYRARLGVTSP